MDTYSSLVPVEKNDTRFWLNTHVIPEGADLKNAVAFACRCSLCCEGVLSETDICTAINNVSDDSSQYGTKSDSNSDP